MSLKKFISTIDYSLIRDVIVKFLKSKDTLQDDYTLEELETFFETEYDNGCMSNKDIVAIWNFKKIINEYKEAA